MMLFSVGVRSRLPLGVDCCVVCLFGVRGWLLLVVGCFIFFVVCVLFAVNCMMSIVR